ncbi:hypothetical protein BOSEA31B_12477 [Hyphomicrobiales bacterium]|nr:hypothetical protein BOSEA31B_12477 [Hyphomicrobiales bacterium]CAI0341921.1 hypothetical protein BO1005MUT1_100011 [Hyphomicrobiales bacterium]
MAVAPEAQKKNGRRKRQPLVGLDSVARLHPNSGGLGG